MTDADNTVIDIEALKRLIPHRYPFLLIDRLTDVRSGVGAVGWKAVTINEPHFQGHFPNYAVMPGVLIVEAMAQAAGALVVHTLNFYDQDKSVYFLTIDKARFRKPVHPGDLLRIPVVVQKNRGPVWRFEGKAYIGDQLCAEAEFSAMIMDRNLSDDANVSQLMGIHPSAIVEAGAKVGGDVEIGPFAIVGPKVVLGEGVKLHGHVVVTGTTEIGAGTIVHSHAVLGGPAQYRGDKGEGARLVIGPANVIREHMTMNAGSAKGGGLTSVGARGYFMSYSHVAHDCHIGDDVTFANGAQLGGHCTIGDGANIGGLSAIQQFGRIGRGAFVGGLTGVPDDVIPYGIVVGERARLLGLNLIGLKRKGLSRERIHVLRAAFRAIFFGEGRLLDRATKAGDKWKDSPEVTEIVTFILADAKRPICTPRGEAMLEETD